jgi:hypothetical protein
MLCDDQRETHSGTCGTDQATLASSQVSLATCKRCRCCSNSNTAKLTCPAKDALVEPSRLLLAAAAAASQAQAQIPDSNPLRPWQCGYDVCTGSLGDDMYTAASLMLPKQPWLSPKHPQQRERHHKSPQASGNLASCQKPTNLPQSHSKQGNAVHEQQSHPAVVTPSAGSAVWDQRLGTCVHMITAPPPLLPVSGLKTQACVVQANVKSLPKASAGPRINAAPAAARTTEATLLCTKDVRTLDRHADCALYPGQHVDCALYPSQHADCALHPGQHADCALST